MRTAGLEAVQALMHESGKLIAPCTIRWLSVDHSIHRLKSCIQSIFISFLREKIMLSINCYQLAARE